MSAHTELTIRPLLDTDAPAFFALRLAALAQAPAAFGASLDEERDMSLAEVAARLDRRDGNAVLGAWLGAQLVGTAGVARMRPLKMRHKAVIWTVYIDSGARGRGYARRLMQAALEHARGMQGIRQVMLSVTADNLPALTLYQDLGFIEYGHEPAALCVDGMFLDEKLMVLVL